MAATVEICESNTSGQTVTHSISTSDQGAIDAPNQDAVANAIAPGARSVAKYQRFHLTALGGSSKIDNLKVWRTGALGGAATHVTNARTASYAGAAAYATPVATAITGADQTMPTAAPATANLGIGGSLTGALTAVGYSDYLIHQIVSNAADTNGSSSTMNYQYDETA